jgi:putative ABC transport system substrate-binding protein
MKRRRFIGTLAAGILASRGATSADRPARPVRIGLLRMGEAPFTTFFWDAMRKHGWVEHQNFTLEPRYARDASELNALAAELVRLGVDLILTDGTPATRAARNATSTIPIVFVLAADPVENGLVASLARPGGNLTGIAFGFFDAKQLQILKQAVPRVARVACLTEVRNPELVSAGAELGIEVKIIAGTSSADLPNFFAEAKQSRVDAAVFPNTPWSYPTTESFAAEALRLRMPSVGTWRNFAVSGGLIAYGPDPSKYRQRMIDQVDKILRGRKPADLPVVRPTEFYLAINLRTAKALDVSIPPSLVLRADELIE